MVGNHPYVHWYSPRMGRDGWCKCNNLSDLFCFWSATSREKLIRQTRLEKIRQQDIFIHSFLAGKIECL